MRSHMSMWWSRRFALTLLMLATAALLTVCVSHSARTTRFVFSGNDLGFIRPCGCSKPVLGGIARRGGMLALLRQDGPLVPLSTGNLVAESGRQQRLKFESMLLAMSSMGYRALAPGAGEFGLGLSYLREAEALAGFPFVCLNVVCDGATVFARSVSLEDSWVVTGLVPQDLTGGEITVQDPVIALREFVATLSEQQDLVVLWNGSEAALAALAQALPEERRARTVFAVSCVGDAPRPLDAAGSMAVAVGSKGRDLMLLQPGATPFWRSIRLEESVPLDPECAAILEGYRDGVRAEDLLAAQPRTNSAAYSGGASCRECHEECHKALESSAHMHALATLERTRDERDPECVRCHVVGLEDTAGWTPQRPELANVDCEACHGPSELHAQTQALTPVSKPAPQSCLRCHDMDNSPTFEFQSYWLKIRHGGK